MSYIVDLRKQEKVAEPPKQQPKQPKEIFKIKGKSEVKKEPEIATAKSSRFQWEAPSFYYNPQKKYLAIVVIALAAGAGTILYYGQDMFLAILLMLSSLILVLYANKKPNILHVSVDQIGVSIDNKMYYYKELKSFWIDYTPHGPKELSLEARKWYLPYVKISIEGENPTELRSLMINFVPEKMHEPSLIDFISRKIGL